MKRYARKPDRNQAAIVAALRAAGVRVSNLSASGMGVPDLACSTPDRMLLVEVKAPGEIRKAGKYRATVRARQIAWAALHSGHVLTATTADEVLAALGLTPANPDPTLAGGRAGAALEEPRQVFRKNAREGNTRSDG